MPHVTISAVPGHSEEEKQELAHKIVSLVADNFHVKRDLVSVSIREIPEDTWMTFAKEIPSKELYVIPPYLARQKQ